MSDKQTAKPTFHIRKIYLKDTSFESPNAPGVFSSENANPNVTMQVSVARQNVGNNHHNVILSITLTAKVEESTLFLCEVEQAGLFEIVDMPEDRLVPMLEIACPSTLLPFAREAIADLVQKGGFPQMLISPINFEQVFKQKQEQIAAAEKEAAGAPTH